MKTQAAWRRAALAMVGIVGSGSALASISGTVYRDFNADGARTAAGEPGVADVVITAYAPSGAAVSAISAANGSYTLATAAGITYRLELTDQASFLLLGGAGTAGATSDVRFVADGATAVDFGVNNPAQYCSSAANADILNAQLVRNPQTPAPVGVRSLGSWDYNTDATDAVGTQTDWAYSENNRAGENGTGSIWGVAYRRRGDLAFTSSFLRRGSPQGEDFDSLGAIYKSVRAGATISTSLYVDLNAAAYGSIDLGTNPHPRATTTDWTEDTDATFRDVGRVGFGGIDLSDDEQTLYAMNLFQRELLIIPIGSAATPSVPASDAAIIRRPVPFPTGCDAASASTGAPSQADFRPFAVKVFDGKVYVGAVCNAQSMRTAGATIAASQAAMRAYVFRFDPATNTFEDGDSGGSTSADPILAASLSYPRRFVNDGTTFSGSGPWLPWIDAIPTTVPTGYGTAGGFYAYPQAMLTDIELDGFGFMTLGFADRHGYQAFDTDDPGPPAYSGTLVSTRTGGEVLLACEQDEDTFSLETGGSCTSRGVTRTGGDPHNNGAGDEDNTNSGPGNKEFYFAERFNYRNSTATTDSAITAPDYHRETADGGLALLLGSGSVGVTTYDVGDAFNNGVRFLRNGNVARTNTSVMSNDGGVAPAPAAPTSNTRYHEFRATDGDTPRFGKANGMGDIEILCSIAPLQIGNRVWNDLDADGVQDGDEPGISGVTVRLYRGSDGAQLGQATTDANGNYQFTLTEAATTVTGGATSNVSISIADLYGQTVVVGLPGTDGSGLTTNTLGVPASFALTLANVDTGTNREARDSDATAIDPAGAPTLQAAIAVALPTKVGDNRFDADFGLTVFADQGDLPDTGAGTGFGNYETLKGVGPVAIVSSTLRINTVPDSEFNGQPDVAAFLDGADEDGLTNSSGTITLAQGGSLTAVTVTNVANTTGSVAQLCGFIDLNGDGDFADANEKAVTAIATGTTANRTLNFGLASIPATAPSITYARLRLIQGAASVCPTATGDNGGANGYGVGLTGAALGEVEDYRVSITGLNADIQVAASGFACTVGASSDFTITVTSPETYNNGSPRIAGTINTATMTYVVPDTFARMDWAIDPATLDDGEVCLSGCSGSVSSISGSPGTITAVLYLPNDSDGTNPSVVFQMQGVVRSSVTAGTSITNTAVVSQPGNLNNDVAGNNTSSTGGTCAAPPPTVNTAICAEPGKDTLAPASVSTISAVNTQVNTYYTPRSGFTGTIASGAECLPLDGTSTVLGSSPVASFSAGDLLLVMQMQDGTYDTTDGLAYGGTVTDGATDNGAGFANLGSAGLYEFVQVDGAVGSNDCAANQLPITGSGANFGLLNNYFHTPTATSNREVVQFIKVPQYKGLTISGTGSAAAAPWNGLLGGVVVVDVRDTLTLAGASCAIDASADGFRGAGNNPDATPTTATSATYLDVPANGGGQKGEGLVGTPPTIYNGTATAASGAASPGYLGGAARAGAPGNAGGGGRACNTTSNDGENGGGGGGNGGAGGAGGRESIAGSCLLATAVPGVGGAPVGNSPALLAMGGGGGGGVLDTNTASELASGMPGGGIVIVRANAVTGSGSLCANGMSATGTTNDDNIARGGGGAGGSIQLFSNIAGSSNFTGVTAQASGGAGGSRSGGSTNGGAGGGGGGGRIFLSTLSGTAPALTVTGGAAGAAGGAAASAGGIGTTTSSLNPYNSTPGAKPGFLCSSGTVPVTLSDVESTVEGGSLVVRFGTASEAGTVGFRIHGDLGAAGVRTALVDRMIPAKGASLQPQRYEARGNYSGQTQLWIEELTSQGRSTFYGPYPVGARSGESNIAVSTDWQAIRGEQAAYARRYAEAVLGRGRGSAAEVELRVDQDGWIRVRHEDLLAIGVDWSGIPSERLELSRAGVAVGLERLGGGDFGAGKAVAFYGQAVKGSLYTRSNVYRLRVGSSAGASIAGVFAGLGTLSPRTDARARFEHAPNRLYSFSSPLSDPWFAQRVVRNGTPSASADETFVLPAKASLGSERLEVELWGGLDYPETPDHSVRILLNGTEVARQRFDGITRALVSVNLPAGVLVGGSNTLRLELLDDTGLGTDVVQLEAIRIDYTRALVAEGNRLQFDAATTVSSSNPSDTVFANDFSDEGSAACRSTDAACVAYEVSGLTRADLGVLRIRGNAVERLTGTVSSADGGGFRIGFASALKVGDRFVIEPPEGGVSAQLSPALPVADPMAGGPASYLIITHGSFAAGLAPLIAARQAEGFSVRVLDVDDLYRRYSGGVVDPMAISQALLIASRQLGTRYVLLVGGDTYDYANYSGANSLSFIPTHYRPISSIVQFAPADSVYADVDGDGRSDLALGRWPVRSLQELDAMVSKTLAYATAGHAGKVALLTDRDQNSVSFADVLNPLLSYLGEDWTPTTISLQSYPVGGAGTSQARADLVGALGTGQAVLSYFGHSAPSSWTREGLVTANLVYGGLVPASSKPTALWQLGCWGAYFVEPRYNTVAHGLLLQNGGGAAAVLGASALTETASDSAWINVLAPRLVGQRLGDAQRAAQRLLHDSGGERIDISVGATLLGDPALLIQRRR